MKYFKNTELAKLYKVSEKSVRNWIESAHAGKNDLQLHEEKDKSYIANTTKNNQLIGELVEKGKKFKNSRGFKVITPTKEFYSLYDQTQVFDIISNLTIHHEIPTVYTYADGGAKYWDEYAERLRDEQTPNILTKTIELLESTSGNVDTLIPDAKKINVIDLGPGNGLPIQATLSRLIKQGRLSRYIAIDGNKDMLRILEKNLKKWFGDDFPFEGYVRDFSRERFDDLFVDDYGDSPINLIFLLGGTLGNFRSPNLALQTINSSMGLNDLLLYTGYLDTLATRRYFDYSSSRSNQKFRSELILGFLGIDESLYDMELKFNEEKKSRVGNMQPKVDLSIKFELAKGTRYVELRKGEPVLIWRHVHKDAVDIIKQFDQNDFDIMQMTKSLDGQYLLLTSKIKTGH